MAKTELRVVRTAFVVCLAASPLAYAFDTGHHFDATRTVLHERGFGETAIEIAQIYNWLTDYYSISPTSKTPIQGAREVKADVEKLHFDNLFTPREIAVTWGWLIHNLETATREAARDERPEHALILLGIAVHAVQDFYTHSNWVELHPRAPDGPYRCNTYPAVGPPRGVDLHTGMYEDGAGYRDPERPRTEEEHHGDYHDGLNKDSHVRPRWDEAYAFSYCATHEVVAAMERWAEQERPGFWKTVREYTYGVDGALSGSLDGVRPKTIEMSLKAVHDLSMWAEGFGEDGHWKGNHSGSKRFFAATSAEYVSRGRGPVGNAILKELLHRKLTTNLYSSVPPSSTPKIEPYSLDRRAVIVRVTRIAEKKDLKKLERSVDPRAISRSPDYYAKITIDGQLYLDRTLQDWRDFNAAEQSQDAWVAMHFVDASVTEVPIEIEVWDEDDTSAGGAYKDTQADINPAPGKRSIELRLRLSDGRITGDVESPSGGASSPIITVGERPDKYRAVMTFHVAQQAVGEAGPVWAWAEAPTTKTLASVAALDAYGRTRSGKKLPYADMSDTLGTTTAIPIRGRLIKETLPLDLAAAIPFASISQREMKKATVELVVLDAAGLDLVTLGDVDTDREGYIDTVLTTEPGRLAPGRCIIEVRHEKATIGRLQAHLLDENDRGVVIRSDVDMTYLNTDFEGTQAKMELLNRNAREREALPGMAAVYRALRTGAGGDLDRPLVFISGSPQFFKRTLEAKLDLDGIIHDGVTLKPFKAIAWDAKFEPWKIAGNLGEQVGYKLHALLRGRLEMPPGMSEILMGDDTEADAQIYSLYHRFTSHRISPEAMRARLREMEVEPFWLDRIDLLLDRVLAGLDLESPVKAIYINRTDGAGPHRSGDDWAIPEITVYHAGAEPLIVDLVDKGWAPKSAIAEVKADSKGR
jgi:hypothetical protein